MGLIRYMINTIIIVLTTAFGVVTISCLSGYVFAQLTFPFKRALYIMIIAVLMVPSIVTLTPTIRW